MSRFPLDTDPLFLAGRRSFLGTGVLFSATTVALLAGRPALAAQMKKPDITRHTQTCSPRPSDNSEASR